MVSFNVGLKAPKNHVSAMIEELKRTFKAKISGWEDNARLNDNNTWDFHVTVEDNLRAQAEAYCRSKFLMNNDMPGQSEPMGRIY
jgi:hypothetical protein